MIRGIAVSGAVVVGVAVVDNIYLLVVVAVVAAAVVDNNDHDRRRRARRETSPSGSVRGVSPRERECRRGAPAVASFGHSGHRGDHARGLLSAKGKKGSGI